jgi:probable H4MPT-linked C1 transfer pathway protein
MDWLGLDVGGANLKLASCRGFSQSVSFALWQRSHELVDELCKLISRVPDANGVAVTMTGELADCFQTKTHGVLHILDAVEQAAGEGRVSVYCVDGQFISPESARRKPLLAAASNWHALAKYACRWAEHFPAVLIDVGSTTTDIVWLSADGPNTTSTTDMQRLLSGELVYTGIGRTSIAAITPVLPYRGRLCPVAAESFATAADIAVLLDFQPEQPLHTNTADGRPLTKHNSRDRMARMMCADHTEVTLEDTLLAAQFAWEQQAAKVAQALKQVIDVHRALPSLTLLSGSGEALAGAAVETAGVTSTARRLSSLIGNELSCVAPAYAVAVLASELESES